MSRPAASDLQRFLFLFEAIGLEVTSETESTVEATAEFELDPDVDEPGDQFQEICWTVQLDLDDALSLAEAAKSSGLLYSDRLTADPEELSMMAHALLGWSGSRADRALRRLLEIRVDMIDDGEKTDYFFIHL